jgi:hypothetical protein
MDKDFIFEKGIDIAILICILKVVFIGKMSFEDVGILIGLGNYLDPPCLPFENENRKFQLHIPC